MKKDLLAIKDITNEDMNYIFELAEGLKNGIGAFERPLSGKSVGLIFQKPSNRTRLSFEVGVFQLGGNAIYMTGEDIKLGVRESIKDVAKVQSKYLDGIITRTFLHKDVATLAKYADVPVINGLSDLHHPCQAVSDIFTLREKFGKLAGLTLAYVGDGNNVLHSLMGAAALAGVNIKFSTPPGYEPKQDILEEAKEAAAKNKTDIAYFKDPEDAVKGADAVYTDVWTSMGQEAEGEKRLADFEAYQVNEKLFAKAKKDAVLMHCLPAHRGEEVTDALLDGPNSIVIEQAENRLHVQKAILVVYVGGKKKR